jgi:hypothetical protein
MAGQGLRPKVRLNAIDAVGSKSAALGQWTRRAQIKTETAIALAGRMCAMTDAVKRGDLGAEEVTHRCQQLDAQERQNR